MSNEVRPFKHHRHGGMGGEGYSAKLGKYVLDARQDPTGVALMNEHGRVNVHMVPVDLVTSPRIAARSLSLGSSSRRKCTMETSCGQTTVVRATRGYVT